MNGIQSEIIDDMLHITMPRVLDIPAAADLKDIVLEMVEPEMAVSIQSADVEQMTTPGIQVLLAVAAYIDHRKAKLKVVKPSEAFINGFSDLGLFSHLMAWNVE